MKNKYEFRMPGLLLAVGLFAMAMNVVSAGLIDPGIRVCRTVQANQEWQNTGITVSPTDFVCVAAYGLWSHGVEGNHAIIAFYGPEGFAKNDPNVPEPAAYVGALIAKIGGSEPFAIEDQLCFIPLNTGALWLSMNDDPGSFGNNSGVMYVRISKRPVTSPLPQSIDLDARQCQTAPPQQCRA